jgi:hypothetical protein
MKKPQSPIDYSIRSVAGVRDAQDPEGGVAFQVLCYGMPYSTLTSVDMSAGELNMSGGSQVRRRLDARGIDTNRFFCDVFTTAPVNDRFDSDEGRTPSGRSYLPPVMGD